MLHQLVHLPQVQAWCLQFNRLFVGACSQLCQVDLYEVESFRRGRPPRNKRNKRQRSWIALLTDLVCLYCSVKILANCYLQYQHDIKSLQCSSLADNSSDAQLIQLEREQWRRRLKLIGAPYINYAFLAQCFYEYALWITLVAYYCTRLYFRLVVPLNISSVRALLDEGRERLNYQRLIRDECRKLVQSIRCHRHFHQDEPCRHRQHSQLIRLVGLLASSGRLRPFNRCQQWLHWLSFICCCLSASFVTITTLMTAAIMFVVPFSNWVGRMDFAGFMDYMTVIEGFTLGLINIASVGFYLTLIVVMTADQIQPVLELNRAIRLVVGRAHLARLSFRLSETEQTKLSLQLNGQLLRVLLHHKLLVRQMRPLRQPNGFLAFACVQILLFGPLVCRLHIRFLDQRLTELLVVLCLIVVFWCDLSMGPICYLYGQYERLYRSLFNLMAHVVAVESWPEQQGRRLVYDRHLLALLVRELAHPHQLVEQFATRLAGALKLNYSTLLRAHFWLGLLVMSSWFSLRNKSSAGKLNIFDNPFGLL